MHTHTHTHTYTHTHTQVSVMLQALRAKFGAHDGPRNMLLASGTAVLVEAAPHDFVWGGGHNGRCVRLCVCVRVCAHVHMCVMCNV
jgi:predicted NAD-dependent protein-ADP-ribosyltransferase YbiA (DUF1768 family)